MHRIPRESEHRLTPPLIYPTGLFLGVNDPIGDLYVAPPIAAVTSIYVWGSDRAEVNSAARRVAARLDRNYAWVQAAAPAEESFPEFPSGVKGRILPGTQLLPPPALSEERLWSYVRPSGPRQSGRDLLEFLRMSDPLQEAVAELLERPAPRVLALGNWDLLPDLPGQERRSWAGLIRFLKHNEISLIASAAGRPLPERIDFDYSIATPELLPSTVRGIAAVCQWGDCHDCVVNRFFPQDEVVCINRLAAGPACDRANGIRANGFASH